MPILTSIFFTFNWLTLTSEMHFVKFHPEVASCLLSRGKRKYAPLGMRLLWKYIRNFFVVYQLISRFLSYLQNHKEFEAEILDLQSEKYGLSFDIKKYTTSGWALGDENVIGIRAFKQLFQLKKRLSKWRQRFVKDVSFFLKKRFFFFILFYFFLSIRSKFRVVWTIRFCSNFTSMWYKQYLRNEWSDFRLPMSVLATVARKSFNFTAKINFSIRYFILPLLFLTFEV